MLTAALISALAFSRPAPAPRPALHIGNAPARVAARFSPIFLDAATATEPEQTAVAEAAPVKESGPPPVQDALAGLTVAFSLLSKAIAASAIAGVEPLVGIWSSVMMGVTAPLLGSRAGVISGAAAVVVVPLGALVAKHGTQYIPLVILASAVFQALFAVFKLARFTRIISNAVLSGFLNGLGLLLIASQIPIFTKAPAVLPAVAVATLCAGVTQYLPKVTTAVPSSLAGLGIATVLGALSGQPLKTLGAVPGGLDSLPSFIDFGAFAALATSPAALKIALPVALSVSFISILETLLSAKVVDDLKCEETCVIDDVEVSEDNAWSTLFSSKGVFNDFLELNDPTTRDKKAVEIFNKIDDDGSGEIDEDELKQGLADLGIVLSDAEVSKMVADADLDGNKLIDVEEFKELVRSQTAGNGEDVASKSVMAMAVGNFLSSILGGFGGCGLIPQTVLNMKSGGGGPLSSMVYAVSMAAFVLVFAPAVAQISKAALAGLMFTVAYATIQWDFSMTAIRNVFSGKREKPEDAPLVDLATLGLTTYLCYAVDMGTGIVLGVVGERVFRAVRGFFKPGQKVSTA